MSVFFGRRERRDDASDLIARHGRGRATSAGVFVDDAAALRHTAVWSSLSAIAEAVQQLPLDEVRLAPDGSKITRRPPAVFYQPTPDLPWETWIWQQTWTLAATGKAYALVTSVDGGGWPRTLVPIAPADVSWTFDTRANAWTVKLAGEPIKLWPLGPLWHCPLYPVHGAPEGLSPIAHHAESIGVGLAAQRFGAQFFGDGGHPTMTVTTDRDPGDAGAKALKAKIMGVLAGNREPLVLPAGVKLDRWQVAPDESQFLDTMRYSGEDVARIFGVPPGKIGLAVSGQNVTYSNADTANADWRVSGLSRYVVPLEACLSRLVPAGATRTLRFNFNAFLRADLQARAAFYKTAAEIGDITGTPLLHVNEMRNEEGLSPITGGDVFARRGMAPPVQARERLTDEIISS